MKIWEKRDTSVTTIEEAHNKKLGISSKDALSEWVKKGKDDKYFLPGTEAFTELLYRYKNRPVYIMGDYDVDGICATCILKLTLKWLGFANVKHRIPKRFSEGYGMNRAMVDEIKEDDALIITVDNGIAAMDVVSYAKSKGHAVIVTDHHEPVKTEDSVVIPRADLVIDPKAFPGLTRFDGYCGAGIAYKLARHLLKGIKGRHLALLPLAALATACDQMPIREENYYLLKMGLQIMNQYGQTDLVPKGLRALGEVAGITHWTEDKFTFNVGPMLNSKERMSDGGADDAIELLECGDLYQCRLMAEKVKETNEQRKKMVSAAVEGLSGGIEKNDDGSVVFPLIRYLSACSEGIIGIIAGQLLDKYGVPAGVFTDAKETDLYKGSFRSTDDFDIMSLLIKHRDMFEACGGHAAAAGASVKKEKFDSMVKAMQKSASSVKLSEKKNLYDVEIDNADIRQAIEENGAYAPFGQGNEDLIFKIVNFCPEKRFGEWKKTLKGNGFKLSSKYSDAIGFNLTDVPEITSSSPVTIYGHISMNVFNGKETPQIMILDIAA